MESRVCGFCNETITFEKITQFASHRCHCKKNPTYAQRIAKCAQSNRLPHNEYKFICKCSKEFSLELTETLFQKGHFRKHCSRNCANIRIQSEETRRKKSEKLRGRKYFRAKQQKIHSLKCKQCEKLHSNKHFCSRNCLKLFFQSQRSEIENYRQKCQFKFNVYDFPQHFDLSLLSTFGWYTASNRGGNLNGISRDHLLSISEGFKQNIDPKYIAHPANCKLVQHTINQKKNFHSSIDFNELLTRINQFCAEER